MQGESKSEYFLLFKVSFVASTFLNKEKAPLTVSEGHVREKTGNALTRGSAEGC